MKLNELQSAIVLKLKDFLPSLRQCESHGGRFDLEELKARAAQSPAAFVALLNIKGVEENGDGTVTLRCLFSIFLVTTDKKGLRRDEAGRNLTEAVSAWLPNNRFDVQDVGAPASINAGNLYNGSARKDAVALWAVAWEQKVTVGSSDFAEGVLPAHLYIRNELQETDQ